MRKYIITGKVVKEIYTEYIFQAETEKEAIKKWEEGKDILNSETTEEVSNEEICEIEFY